MNSRCSIAVLVNGERWQAEGDALEKAKVLEERWSLVGLLDYVQLIVGTAVGRTFEQIDVVEQRIFRSRPIEIDAEAVQTGFDVINAAYVDAADPGQGLALEAIETFGRAKPDVVVLVGASAAQPQLRQKLESSGAALFECLLLPAGNTFVSTSHIIDMRSRVRSAASGAPESALARAPLVAKTEKTPLDSFAATAAETSKHLGANSILGVVKQLANGYGIAVRRDGFGEIQFLAAHVEPPGFEFIEVGDTVRFDAIQLPSGKLQAKRVSRM